jgi:DNA-binding response OmpR family regulator
MDKILLLEDDANLNETVTEFLTEKGYDVVSVYDGYEAQEKLFESKYDLLLLDVNTPGMNGFDLLKEARENDVNAPAVFITSLDSVDDLEKGFDSGCDDYIRKPFALKELYIRIDTLLKRAFYHESKEFIPISKNISYDIKNNELIIDGKTVSLGHKEAMLLKLFMKNEGEEEYTKVDEEQRDILKITDDGFVLEHYKGTESSPCCYHTFTKTD